MMLGGFVSACDRRFRLRRPVRATVPESVRAGVPSETHA
jgi:cytochrome c-type biogenesis protein CcmF